MLNLWRDNPPVCLAADSPLYTRGPDCAAPQASLVQREVAQRSCDGGIDGKRVLSVGTLYQEHALNLRQLIDDSGELAAVLH